MSTPTDIGTLIVRSPEIRGGRPRVADTGVTVQRIASWYRLGLSPDEIAEEIPHLSIAQVYAAHTWNLHSEYLSNGRTHAGMILVPQQRYGVGAVLRRILRLAATLSAEDMVDRAEFLSAWEPAT